MPADVIYSLDKADRIIEVNDAWTWFAEANDGPELIPPAILGRSVWDFISDPTTVQIYRLLFQRVRAGAGPVTFPLRCDSPSARRFLEMTIADSAGKALEIVVRTLQVEPRPVVTLLNRYAVRSDVVIRMCAWCMRLPDIEGAWLEVEDALPRLGLFGSSFVPLISHGMCDGCRAAVLAALDANAKAKLETQK